MNTRNGFGFWLAALWLLSIGLVRADSAKDEAAVALAVEILQSSRPFTMIVLEREEAAAAKDAEIPTETYRQLRAQYREKQKETIVQLAVEIRPVLDLPEEEQKPALMQKRERIKGLVEALKTWVAQSLTEKQRVRLTQIFLWMHSPQFLLTEQVAQELKITKAQIGRIAAILQDYQKQRKLSHDPTTYDPLNPAQRRQKEAAFHQLWQQTDRRVQEALTPEQRTQWNRLRGRPYTPRFLEFLQSSLSS